MLFKTLLCLLYSYISVGLFAFCSQCLQRSKFAGVLKGVGLQLENLCLTNTGGRIGLSKLEGARDPQDPILHKGVVWYVTIARWIQSRGQDSNARTVAPGALREISKRYAVRTDQVQAALQSEDFWNITRMNLLRAGNRLRLTALLH